MIGMYFFCMYIKLCQHAKQYVSIPEIVAFEHLWLFLTFFLAVLSEQNRRFIIYRWISKSNGSKYSCSKVEYDA